MRALVASFALAVCAVVPAAHAAPPPDLARPLADLGREDAAARETAVKALGARNDPKLLPLFEALRAGSVYVWSRPGAAPQVVIGGEKSTAGDRDVMALAAAYGAEPLGIQAPVAELREVPVDRALRLVIKPFIDALSSRGELLDPDPAIRRAAATRLGQRGDLRTAAVLREALVKEADRWTRATIEEAIAIIELGQGAAAARAAAATRLGALHSANALPALRAARDVPTAAAAVRRLERWQLFGTTIETLFQGLSLASILLLMALGLAIIFGLMGVINMAHGELMALGAYATYTMQNWFAGHLAERWFDYYFLAALPFAFLVAAAVGLLLERGVIRFLYGRPLETLLLTWGVSLIIQQGLRQWFGAANVDVRAPRYLSGGVPIMAGVQLPYNRLFIIGLAAVSVAVMYALLFRTTAGVKIRAVMQNRQISSCLGIRARRVDAGTFALGAGLAGLAGCALTQIGNVGPELGQNYIVDSFMVVVTGGVGKLAGTIAAALGIGGLDKAIEPGLGAVYGRVLILVLVILFLQRRPSGLFALKGRHADA
jgi:urea transport system permease protein